MGTKIAAVLIAVGAIFLLIMSFVFAIKGQRFSQELRYLNMEIGRTTGSEQAYWRDQRRKLWLSIFKFWKR